MPRANRRIAQKQTAGLLDETSLKAFRSELTTFLELPTPFRQRLEKLAAQEKPDRKTFSGRTAHCRLQPRTCSVTFFR
jgi:hypothetical protein